MKSNIGIITWHYYYNFGSALQSYALMKIINANHKCEIINYRNLELNNNTTTFEIIHYLLSISLGKAIKRFYYPYIEFQRKYLKQSKIVHTNLELCCLAKKYTTVVCGSDQIWAPSVLDKTYLLDFITSDRIKKVSYAASIGLNDIPMDMRDTYRINLSSFSHISVREEKGIQLLKTLFSLDASVVLDPTLLLKENDYLNLIKPCNISGDFVFCYFLSPNSNYIKRIQPLKGKKKIVVYTESQNNFDFDVYIKNIGPSEFLWLIQNASEVITDSYHGTIFSILFHKNFRIFERFSPLDKNNQNSRIETLINLCGVQDRLVQYHETMMKDVLDIDYDKIDSILEKKRNDSLVFLREALK